MFPELNRNGSNMKLTHSLVGTIKLLFLVFPMHILTIGLDYISGIFVGVFFFFFKEFQLIPSVSDDILYHQTNTSLIQS